MPASGLPAPQPPLECCSCSTCMDDAWIWRINGRSLPLPAWQLCAEEIKHACFSTYGSN
jgi:hypothetical protein